MQQNANFLFYTAFKKVWYSVDAYNNTTCILGVYWTAVVRTFFQAGGGMSSDLMWGGEREASFSECLFFTKKWGRQPIITNGLVRLTNWQFTISHRSWWAFSIGLNNPRQGYFLLTRHKKALLTNTILPILSFTNLSVQTLPLHLNSLFS